MDGFGIDATDESVDYGKVLVFISENRLHQVGITASKVRKRLIAEGKLKDLDAPEEKKEEDQKPNRLSNLFKLYSRTVLFTRRKKKDGEENDSKKDGEENDSKKDGDEPTEGGKEEDGNSADDNKSDKPASFETTPQPDASVSEGDDQAKESTEEETKKKPLDRMKQFSNLFRFFGKPKAKLQKEEEDSTEEKPTEDEEVDKSADGGDETTNEHPQASSKDSTKKSDVNQESEDKSKEPAKEEASKDDNEKREMAPNKAEPKSDTENGSGAVDDNKNKLSSNAEDSMASNDEKGSHIGEFIPSDAEENLESPIKTRGEQNEKNEEKTKTGEKPPADSKPTIKSDKQPDKKKEGDDKKAKDVETTPSSPSEKDERKPDQIPDKSDSGKKEDAKKDSDKEKSTLDEKSDKTISGKELNHAESSTSDKNKDASAVGRKADLLPDNKASKSATAEQKKDSVAKNKMSDDQLPNSDNKAKAGTDGLMSNENKNKEVKRDSVKAAESSDSKLSEKKQSSKGQDSLKDSKTTPDKAEDSAKPNEKLKIEQIPGKQNESNDKKDADTDFKDKIGEKPKDKDLVKDSKPGTGDSTKPNEEPNNEKMSEKEGESKETRDANQDLQDKKVESKDGSLSTEDQAKVGKKTDKRGSVAKISPKASDKQPAKKLDRLSSVERQKEADKTKAKVATKPTAPSKPKNETTASNEKLRSSEKLKDPKLKTTEKAKPAEPSKVSDRRKDSLSSEKARERSLASKRKSDAKGIISEPKTEREGRKKRGESVSVEWRPHNLRNDLKETQKKRAASVGGVDHLAQTLRSSGIKSKKEKLKHDTCPEEPVEECPIIPCRKHKKEVKGLEEVNNVLVITTQMSHTSDENAEGTTLDSPLEGDKATKIKDESSLKGTSKPSRNSLANDLGLKKADVQKIGESNKAVAKQHKPGKIPLDVRQRQDSIPSRTNDKGRHHSTSPEKRKDMDKGKHLQQSSRNQKATAGDKTAPEVVRGKDIREVLAGNASDQDSGKEEWFDTRSSNSEWFDAKSHISIDDRCKDFDGEDAIPQFTDHYSRKQHPYVDPRHTFLDSIEDRYGHGARNSKIPLPTKNNFVGTDAPVELRPNDGSASNLPRLNVEHQRNSRSRSPVKIQEERPSREYGESPRKRHPTKQIVNKTSDVGANNLSNMSHLKLDRPTRPTHLKGHSPVSPGRTNPHLKVLHNERTTNKKFFRSEQQLSPLKSLGEKRTQNLSSDFARKPKFHEAPHQKRKNQSPGRTTKQHPKITLHPPPPTTKNRLLVPDPYHGSRRSHNDLDEAVDESRLRPTNFCRENVCASRCTCLSRSADDLVDFSNSSSILKLTFVPPNKKPAWKI